MIRVLALGVVPALWLLVIVASASENQRAQPLHWLALPFAIALAYATLSSALAFGPVRIAPTLLVFSLVALVASVVTDASDFAALGDAVTRLVLISAYLVWLAAFCGAVVSVWFVPHVPWPFAGNVAVVLVHVLMIVPPLVVFFAFLGSMVLGG